MSFFQKKSPYYNVALFYLLCSLVLRMVLVFHPITQSNFTAFEIVKIFVIGILFDIFVFFIASAILWLYLLFLSNKKYQKPWGYIIFGLLLSLLAYVYFCNTILNEYGGVLPEIGISFIGLKTTLFGLLLFFN